MTRVVYEQRALLELSHEIRWYERRARGTGERLLLLVERIRAIADAPGSFGRDANHPRARRALLPTVPDHDDLRIGTLQSIIRQCGLPRTLFEMQ
jgi:hypothetical protein